MEVKCKCKGTVIPVQAWTGPEGSKRLRFQEVEVPRV